MQWGTTTPLSYEKAKEKDIERTKMMENYLKENDCFETASGHELRKKVLIELENLINNWIRKAIYPDCIDGNEAQLFPFGSYELGVVMPQSDIDLCCVVPSSHRIGRVQFFTEIATVLKLDRRVSKLIVLMNAHTPLIKLNFSSIDLDLLFCVIDDPPGFKRPGRLTVNDLSNDDILLKADDQTARSINGVRVAKKLLELVPNINRFRLALRFIKFWARRRGVYSNIMGYMGGVAWSICVARICQLYPNFSSSQIVHRFFKWYASWNWTKPVKICEVNESKPGLDHLSAWGPPEDEIGVTRGLLMPVLTPSFPTMCATHNVSVQTRRTMSREIYKSLHLLTDNPSIGFDEICHPINLFDEYESFLSIEMYARSATALEVWTGFIESRLRSYCSELSNNEGTKSIRIYPERLSLSNAIRSKEEKDILLETQANIVDDHGYYIADSHLLSNPTPGSDTYKDKDTKVMNNCGSKRTVPELSCYTPNATPVTTTTVEGRELKRPKLKGIKDDNGASSNTDVNNIRMTDTGEKGSTSSVISSKSTVAMPTEVPDVQEATTTSINKTNTSGTERSDQVMAIMEMMKGTNWGNHFMSSGHHYLETDVVTGYKYGYAIIIGVEINSDSVQRWADGNLKVDLSANTIDLIQSTNTWPERPQYEHLIHGRLLSFHKSRCPDYITWTNNDNHIGRTQKDGT